MSTYLRPYMDLQSLVNRLRELQETKQDFVCAAEGVSFRAQQDQLLMEPCQAQVGEWLPQEGLPMDRLAIRQMSLRMDPSIPTEYLCRLRDQRPAVAADLLLKCRPKKRWFVRCIDGRVRAVLSDSYRVIDNLDIAFWSLDVVKETEGKVLYANLDDNRMRISFTTPQIWDRLAEAERNTGTGNHHFTRLATGRDQGDNPEPGLCHPVVTVSNSEVGDGGVNVRYGILVARCVNTAIIETAVNQIHLGKRMDAGIFRPDTQRAEALALKLQIRDAIQAGLHPATFKRIVDQANKASSTEIEAPQTAIANILDFAQVSSEKQDALLAYFLRDYASNAFGLAQATARLAQDVEASADMVALEEAAGAVIRGEVKLS